MIYSPDEISRYTRDLNLFFFKRYFTFRKFVNFLFSEVSRLTRLQKAWGNPSVVYVDPGNICSLHCPLCTTGTNQPGRKRGMMAFSVCRDIVEQLKDYLFFVRLYNWGEPFLNKDIFKMIDYIHSRKVGTIVNSNLNFRDDGLLEKIIASALDYLIVSLDGTTQQSYAAYRRGGDLDLVMENIRKLLAMRKRSGRHLPKIEWLFVINRENQSEVGVAKKMAVDLGVDTLFFTTCLDALALAKMRKAPSPAFVEFGLGGKKDYFSGLLQGTCPSLYNRMVFNWDGGISPCCALDDAQADFGNLAQAPIAQIWNNPQYRSARRFLKKKIFSSGMVQTICQRCLFFGKNPDSQK